MDSKPFIIDSKTMNKIAIQKNIDLQEEAKKKEESAFISLIKKIKHNIKISAENGKFSYEIMVELMEEKLKISSIFEPLGFKVIVCENINWIKISWA